MNALRIGTRGSRLALWQADHVMSLLRGLQPGLALERVTLRTVGDRILDTPLARIGDKGLFTKEIDASLLAGEIDLAVHSLKDLPTKAPEGLSLGAILEREDPRDVLIAPSGKTLDGLPAGARVGTSSLRRRSQLLGLRRDLEVLDLRGNVPTRIEKADKGQYDAIVLARAGVTRLGLDSRITETIDTDRMLPAVGQGAIALQVRSGDAAIAELVARLDHRPTRLAVVAERSLLRRLEGGCQAPIGALGVPSGERLALEGLVADLEGTKILRAHSEGDARSEEEAALMGERLAERLLVMGAREVLDRIFADTRVVPIPTPSGGGDGD